MKSILLGGTAILLAAAPALAQTADPATAAPSATPVGAAPVTDASAQASAPGEIVVTAQKRSERLQKIPLAVSVVSGEALTAQGKPSIESAAQLVPALNFQKSGTTLNQSIFLRGVGTASFSIAGEPSVSTVVDGVVFARSGEAFSDLVDVAQLEVLRGPQGTLFGKNASAGVINITTKQPTRTFGGTAEASYFSGGEYRTRASVNLPLGGDLLSRFTGFYGSYRGNIRNVTTGDKVNGYRHYGARAQLAYHPDQGIRLAFIADYHHNNDDCCAEVIGTGALDGAGNPITSVVFGVLPTPRGDETRAVAQNLVTRTRETGYGFSLQADIPVGDDTLTSISSYRNWKNTEIRDGDFLPAAYVGFNQLHDVGPQHSNTVTQEVRLTSPANRFLSYVVGGFYSRAKSERVFTRDDIVCSAVTGAPTGVLIPCGSTNANPSTFPSATADFGSTFKNLALFGQATANLTPTFRLIGGLRYSHDTLSVFHSRNTTLSGPGIAASFPATTSGTGQPATVFTADQKKSNVSGKAAAQYDFNPNMTGYVSYTRGYKGPAYNVFFNLSATGTNAIAAETSNSYEVGLKNTLAEGHLTLNLDAFYAKYSNFQANNPDVVSGVVVTRFTNAGDVSTRGVEADLSYRPVRDLSINGGIAYTNAHVDQFNQPPGAAVIPSGTQLGFSPKWKGSLALDYRWRMDGPVDLFLGANGNYQSKQLALFSANAVQRQFGTIKGYGIVNLSAGIGDHADRFRLTAQVRNLFDQSYAAAIQNGGPSGSYRYQIPRDADRYYGITGRVNF
ncbi:MAG: TonB-dependent receptor [Pseudomonadota bacterium]|nr:TonB-dependent receptor [Pseudomonadota bacterium]